MPDPLLTIQNHHTDAAGAPPLLIGDDISQYIGYFENPFGEQWIFIYSRKTGKAVLRGGDVGWANVIEIVNGSAAGRILGPPERLWLQACWSAATSSNA